MEPVELSRAQMSEMTFDAAAKLASENEMRLTNPSAGCFQLRHHRFNWIINLYPRHNGRTPRVYNDRSRPGPFLKMPSLWTLLDAVEAAIVAVKPKNKS